MKAHWTVAVVLVAATLFAGCDQTTVKEPPKPQEISDTSIGHFCGMQLWEHPGPKGQIFVFGKQEPVWFASVRETFAFTMLPEEPKTISAIYVSDMGMATNWERPEPGTWIDAKHAHYVIGSRRRVSMGVDDVVPFGEEAQAKRFAAENGGRVVSFGDMPENFILQYGDTDPAHDAPERREARKP